MATTDDIATDDEIERRVKEADSTRHAKRTAAAKQIGTLAQRRAAIAEQLDDIERELGDVLVDANDVLDIDELARFTDVPAADLTRWLAARTTTRAKRKKSTVGALAVKSDTSPGPAVATAPAPGQRSALPAPAVPRANGTDAPARVPAEVT
ncbi:MAG TPA: hypothetical protein VGD84_17560 [Pseudonocardiaceae bacterium]